MTSCTSSFCIPCRSCCTSSSNFFVAFPPGATPDQKAMVMAAAFLANYLYFRSALWKTYQLWLKVYGSVRHVNQCFALCVALMLLCVLYPQACCAVWLPTVTENVRDVVVVYTSGNTEYRGHRSKWNRCDFDVVYNMHSPVNHKMIRSKDIIRDSRSSLWIYMQMYILP